MVLKVVTRATALGCAGWLVVQTWSVEAGGRQAFPAQAWSVVHQVIARAERVGGAAANQRSHGTAKGAPLSSPTVSVMQHENEEANAVGAAAFGSP